MDELTKWTLIFTLIAGFLTALNGVFTLWGFCSKRAADRAAKEAKESEIEIQKDLTIAAQAQARASQKQAENAEKLAGQYRDQLEFLKDMQRRENLTLQADILKGILNDISLARFSLARAGLLYRHVMPADGKEVIASIEDRRNKTLPPQHLGKIYSVIYELSDLNSLTYEEVDLKIQSKLNELDVYNNTTVEEANGIIEKIWKIDQTHELISSPYYTKISSLA